MTDMSLYQQVIHQTRYARWNEEDKRRESWEETTQRYVDYFDSFLLENYDYSLTDKIKKAVKAALYKMEVMPSMRTLMTAGRALDSAPVSSYNCLSGDTLVLTRELGSVPLKEVAGSTVTVLNSLGNWVSAPITHFGDEELYSVTVRKKQDRIFKKVIRATRDHRWITTDGERITCSLKKGDVIPLVAPARPCVVDSTDYKLGVVHGIVYGDGTRVFRKIQDQNSLSSFSVKVDSGYKIRICGDSDDLLPYFLDLGYKSHVYDSTNGDPVVSLNDSFTRVFNLKELPPEDSSLQYILGFFRGWMAADGSVSKTHGQVTLCTDEKGMEWLYQWVPTLGIEPRGNTRLPDVTNYGTRNRPTYNVRFASHTICDEDILIARKRANLISRVDECYTVESVARTGVNEAVYCATVDSTHDFVIENSLLTGNCAYLVVDSIRSFSEHMYVLMCGTGSGFSVEKRFVDKLPEVPSELHPTDTVIVVADSRKGWCVALNQLLNLLFAGSVPKWDVSKVRPEGARLKTFGGYSSGPGVLEELFRHIIKTFEGSKGRKMRPIEVFSIMTYIAQIVVVGGVRRCQDVEDLIWTKDGLKTLDDVTTSDFVVSASGELRAVTGKEYTGKKELVRVRTAAGFFDCTPEHRVAVYNKFSFEDSLPDIRWIEAGKLTANDSLVWWAGTLDVPGSALVDHLTPADAVIGHYRADDSSTNRGDTAGINVGALNLVEWSWLLGYLHGDGHVYVNKDNTRTAISFALAADMPETRQKIESLLSKLGVGYQTKARGPRSTWYTIRVRSAALGAFFSQWKLGANFLEVPEFVLRGDLSIRAAYVAGVLDADGSCKGRRHRQGDRAIVVVATTTRERFFKQMAALVSSIGGAFGIQLYKPPQENWQRKYTIALNTRELKDRVASLLRPYSEKVRNDYVSGLSNAGKAHNGIPSELLGTAEYNQLTGRSGATSSKMLSLSHLNRKDWTGNLPTKVLDVTPLGEKFTCDISVDELESYTCNGHLIHNSATICLFDKDDAEMRNAKSGQWWVNNGHFAMANISAVFEGRPRSAEFMDTWRALVASGSGEPGILNRKALWDDAERIGRETRDVHGARIHLGVNPSLRSGTRVLTSEGVFPIETLAGKDILVPNLDGAMSPAKCFLSGNDKTLWEITLKNGQVFHATAEHEWPVYDPKSNTVHKRRTPQLQFGDGLLPSVHDSLPFGSEGDYEDGFLIGWNLGDGWITEREGGIQIGFIVSDADGEAPKRRIEKYLVERCGWKGTFSGKSEINVNNESLRNVFKKFGVKHKSEGLPSSVWSTASEAFRRGIIDGLFSSDGSADERGIGLFSAHESLVKDVQDLLGLYGVNTSITHRTISGAKFPNGKTYDRTYESYALRTRSKKMVQRFGSLFTLTHTEKQERLDARSQGDAWSQNDLRYIESVKETDLKEDVWDITVYDETHCFHLCGVITGNCSEISLRPNEFCNLTGASIRPDDSLETLIEKVKTATILGTWQACISDFDYLRKSWKDNVEDERLLGVCLAGIMDHPVLSQQTDESARWYQALRDAVWDTNKEWAKRLKINVSSSVTAVKPAGNSGELHNVASGIHPRYSPYYVRTIRQSAGDPMTQFLKDNGIPWEVSKQNPRDVVFSFPIKSPDGAVCAPDLTALKQLEHWMHVKTNFTTHTVSCTVYVRDHEWMDVGAWVFENFDRVTGVSFLPYDDHTYEQAPYQPITAEKYDELVSGMPAVIDWSLLKHYESVDTTAVSQDYACVSGACALI